MECLENPRRLACQPPGSRLPSTRQRLPSTRLMRRQPVRQRSRRPAGNPARLPSPKQREIHPPAGPSPVAVSDSVDIQKRAPDGRQHLTTRQVAAQETRSPPARSRRGETGSSACTDPQRPAEPQAKAVPAAPGKPSVSEMKDVPKTAPGMIVIEGDTGPIKAKEPHQGGSPPDGGDDSGRRGGGGGGGGGFHKRLGPVDFGASLKAGIAGGQEEPGDRDAVHDREQRPGTGNSDLSLPDFRPRSHQPLDRHADHADGGDRRRGDLAVDVRCASALHPDAHGGRGRRPARRADPQRGRQGIAAQQRKRVPDARRPAATALVPDIGHAARLSRRADGAL